MKPIRYPAGGRADVAKAVLLALLVTAPATAGAAAGNGKALAGRDLSDISMEDLLNIEVVSVSRKDQKLSRTAAAVFVVTRDDIRRLGATSIPEILRIVPGVQVARIDANKWAVSARGFNGRFANKMLVLIDGRSVYTNLYSGVYWDQNDVMIEDIERIEVIRGPGATMWGANAVNGVINVITRKARDTQGGLVSARAGRDERGGGAVRYGGQAGKGVHYRVFSKAFHHAGLTTEEGLPANDRWSAARGGGRLDWQMGEDETLSIHGDAYQGSGHGRINATFPIPGPAVADSVSTSGGYGQARWERRVSPKSEFALQGYIIQEDRRELFGRLETRTVDFDFQHRATLSGRHDLTWGTGYRRLTDRVTADRQPMTPIHRTDRLSSAFLQDDIALAPERLILTAGAKFQHNSYSGFEVQPTVRLLWTPRPQEAFWGAVSRAVRTPSRRDHDTSLYYAIPAPGPLKTVGLLAGNRQFDSEVLLAYEGGFRRQFGNRVSLDSAAFVNRYNGLQSVEMRDPFFEPAPEPRLVVPVTFGNGMYATTYGVETAMTWTLSSRWRLNAGHTWMNPRLRTKLALAPGWSPGDDWQAPVNQFQGRSSMDLTRRLSFDVALFHVSPLHQGNIPGYVRLDAHLNWKIGEFGEAGGGVRNLLGGRGAETQPSDYSLVSTFRPDVYIHFTWRF